MGIFNPINWKDRIVERPRTYTETHNQDGSRTDTPAPGEIQEPGTQISATNLNQMDHGIQDAKTGCYAHGSNGFEKDDPEALKWFEKAAKAGIAGAQYELGKCCAEGRFVEKDEAEALKWYRKAAGQGDDDAQYALGLLYESGRIVEKNAKKAAKWFGKAAEGGEHAGAMYKYAVCLRDGLGIKKNEPEAKNWFGKAAKLGSEEAKAALKRMSR